MDIVEKLMSRVDGIVFPDTLAEEAANEIEALRTENKLVKKNYDVLWGDQQSLRADYEAEFAKRAELAVGYFKRGTENKRLREALEQILDDLSASTMEFPGHSVCRAAWDQAISALQGDKP